jgi:predicted transcriptional regulator
LEDTFYTDDSITAERACEMLDDIWKRGVEISELESQEGIKLPSVAVASEEKASRLVDAILQNNVDSVLIMENDKPIGLVTQRDVLKELAKPQSDLKNTLIRDLSFTPLVEIQDSALMANTIKNMKKEGLGRIALVKNGQLVGMLT